MLATQCLVQRKPKAMLVTLKGSLSAGVTAKDVALAVVSALASAAEPASRSSSRDRSSAAMSMDQRMTLCNMSIEAGARRALVAPDATTVTYLEGRPHAPKNDEWTEAVARWRHLKSDAGARFDAESTIDVTALAPLVTWGTRPDMVEPVTGLVPDPAAAATKATRAPWSAR